jgi:hypothetical protein
MHGNARNNGCGSCSDIRNKCASKTDAMDSSTKDNNPSTTKNAMKYMLEDKCTLQPARPQLRTL